MEMFLSSLKSFALIESTNLKVNIASIEDLILDSMALPVSRPMLPVPL